MKRSLLAFLLIFCLLLTGASVGEGVQSEDTELELPVPYSLGDFLNRYPDKEISNEDGSVTEVYSGITMETFNAFLAHLSSSEMKNGSIKEVKVQNSNIREGENHSIWGELFFMKIEYRNKNGTILNNTSEDFSSGENVKFPKVRIDGNLAKPTLSFCFFSETGEMRITYPKPFYDNRTRTAKENFELMVSYAEANRIEDAIDAYENIPDAAFYQPVVEYLASHPELAPIMITARYKMAGEYVSFGRYEQDNSSDNGPEAIEWLVLSYDKDSNRSMLISRYALDAVPYNTEYEDVTWEKSSLRTWLNSDFLKTAFTEAERDAILDDNGNRVASEKSDPGESESPAAYRVFLLSSDEASADYGAKITVEENENEKELALFTTDEARKCYPTAYAVSQGVRGGTEDGACSWWLRSPGSQPSCGGRVNSAGTVCSAFVDYEEAAVRPVIWIDLNSEYITSGK